MAYVFLNSRAYDNRYVHTPRDVDTRHSADLLFALAKGNGVIFYQIELVSSSPYYIHHYNVGLWAGIRLAKYVLWCCEKLDIQNQDLRIKGNTVLSRAASVTLLMQNDSDDRVVTRALQYKTLAELLEIN